MKIKVFEPPLPDFDQMSEGGEVKPRKMFVGGMSGIGFNPTGINFGDMNDKIAQQVQASIAESMGNIPDYSAAIADLQSRLDQGLSEADVASQISQAVAELPEGISEADVQRIVDANPGLTKEDVVSLIQQNPGLRLSDIESEIDKAIRTGNFATQSEIDRAIANLPEGLNQADVERILSGADTVSSRDLTEALANIPSGGATREELRELAEEIYREQQMAGGEGGRQDPSPIRNEELREQEIESILDRLLANRGVGVGAGADTGAGAGATVGVDQETVTKTILDMLAEGTLTPEEIQRRIDAGDITKEDVLAIIQGGFNFSEDQFAQLFDAGILTRDEIAALVEQAISDIEGGGEGGITEDDVERIAGATGLTEDDVLRLISESGFAPEGNYATEEGMEHYNRIIQDQFKGITDQLGGFATQEDLAGLEGLFQNYLTPEQLQAYLPQDGQYVTPEQLAAATDNDYDAVIKQLTDKLGDLETKYQDVTDQYEADAVNAQIQQTKDDLDNYFRGALTTGPRTGSTSQFSTPAVGYPGSSPMANLIAGQRQGLGQDPFGAYLKTFTPSYAEYDAPMTAEEYGLAGLPAFSNQYSNPFTGGASYRNAYPSGGTGGSGGATSVTVGGGGGRKYGLTVIPDDEYNEAEYRRRQSQGGGGYNQGGQVSNGIMDLTNFQTNVQPFQNAFRPNVPRN